MRPFKHVAATQEVGRVTRPQNVLGVALCRFRAPWGEIPVAATTELDRITVFFWNDLAGRWDAIERRHAPLTADGTGTDAASGWNWSDRVGLAASLDTVFAVYKRATLATEDTRSEIELRIDRFQVVDEAERRLRLVDSQRVPGFIPGRSLWCGFDAGSRSLVIVGQAARDRPIGSFGPFKWQLAVVRATFDATSGAPTFSRRLIEDPGGFDLDARLDGRTLYVVHRSTADAQVMPLAMMLGSGLDLASGPASDPFYPPLSLHQLNLDTLAAADDLAFTPEHIPGGEHPQIQRTSPLLITFDRLRTRVRLDTPVLPLPPLQPHAVWNGAAGDKIAWLRKDGVDSRGTLLAFDAEALPLSIAGFSTSVHLFQTRDGLVRHAMPFPFAPVSVLALDAGRKEVQLDLLHHRERVGLFRTRFAGTIADGALAFSRGGFEVWDIGHAQIGESDDIIPDPTPETIQFDPTGEVVLTASGDAGVATGIADNTIGTHLTADLSREPVGFFGYTDAGDGGLRVIFAPDIPTLSNPPPLEDEKILRPEQVSGPHVPCEAWVEIAAADFVPSGLPGYFVGIDIRDPSLGSTVEVAIDSIDIAAGQVQRPDGSVPDRILGLTDRDFDDLDAVRLIGPPRVVPLTADDGRVIDVTLTPATPVDGVPFQIDVAIGGVPVPALCAFTQVPPADALPGGPAVPVLATGAPLTVALPLPGRWTMTILLTDTAAGARAADVIRVGESLRRLVWGIPEDLYDRLEITRLHVSFLQYDLEYLTLPNEPRRVTINKAAERATEMRFLGADTPEQGTVDYQARIAVDIPGSGTGATVGRVRGALSSVLELKDLRLTFAYGRPFTTGVLMADQRAANTLTLELAQDRRANVITRTDPARHNAIAGKPIGNSTTPRPVLQIRLETNLLTATLAAIATGLGLFGLFTLASWIAMLFGLIALAGGLGPWGAIVGVTAAVLLFVALVFVLPRAVEDVVRNTVAGTFAAGGPRENLDAAAFLRFGGEGMAEAVARRVLRQAIAEGLDVPAPATEGNALGFDRFRQTFQIVFVSAGICRVLLRLDRCGEFDVSIRPPAQGGDDDDLPGLDRAGRVG